jgi:hypothetical protein
MEEDAEDGTEDDTDPIKLVEDDVEDGGPGRKLVEDDVVEMVDESAVVPRCAAFPRAADDLQMSCSSPK